jgi:hypothetical protein
VEKPGLRKRGLLPTQGLKYRAMNPTKTRLASPKRWDLPELFAFGPNLLHRTIRLVALLTGVLK